MKSIQHITSRKHARRGAAMIIMVCLMALVIIFTGISIYSGMQAFYMQELQKNSSSSALAGASAYFSMDEAGNLKPDPSYAMQIAQQTFTGAANAGSLKGANAQVTGISDNGNGTITIQVSGAAGTSLLSPAGIQQLEMKAQTTAKALKYVPTEELGAISILPVASEPHSYSRIIHLAFPMVNIKGSEILVQQSRTDQQGYILEACNSETCYDLGEGATPLASDMAFKKQVGDTWIIYGSATFDLGKAGVSKGSKLRITHGNDFMQYADGAEVGPIVGAKPLIIDRISIMGYSRLCAAPGNCALPHGYVEPDFNPPIN